MLETRTSLSGQVERFVWSPVYVDARVTRVPGQGAEDRVTSHAYDWRNRRVPRVGRPRQTRVG